MNARLPKRGSSTSRSASIVSGSPDGDDLRGRRSDPVREVADDVHRDAGDLRVALRRLVLLRDVELVVDVEVRVPSRAPRASQRGSRARAATSSGRCAQDLARRRIADERALVADERRRMPSFSATRRAETNMRPVAIRQAMPVASARAIGRRVRAERLRTSRRGRCRRDRGRPRARARRVEPRRQLQHAGAAGMALTCRRPTPRRRRRSRRPGRSAASRASRRRRSRSASRPSPPRAARGCRDRARRCRSCPRP